jgi:hypothetical protein
MVILTAQKTSVKEVISKNTVETLLNSILVNTKAGVAPKRPISGAVIRATLISFIYGISLFIFVKVNRLTLITVFDCLNGQKPF